MIQLQNVSLAFAGQQVLGGLSWTIAPGERVGLIGPNGAGKTTLLRVVAGRLTPDAGTVTRGSLTVGYLEQGVQEVPAGRTVRAEALQAFQDVLDLEAREQEITRTLDAAEDHTTPRYAKLLHDLEKVQARLNAHEAHRMRPRAEATLAGLGFAPDDLGRPLASFSGGWRMRAALARLLLRQPDVLLLDEPTNHLDIDAIDWLEGTLKGYPGAVVIVSHDRYFLDRMVTAIAELTGGQITAYSGNYSYYLEARKERRALQQARYENQQKKIAEVEAFVERFRYNASKASQVQSRLKQLEKMERLKPPPAEEAALTLRIPAPRRSGQVVMTLSSFSKSYPSANGTPTRVFSEAGPLSIERGDKIALIGPNGAGKSTLARILRGTESFGGTREVGHHVDQAFFAQHQSEALDPGHTVLESLREKAPHRSDTELRDLLGAFLFSGDDVFKPVAVLSGGEKSRLALARTLSSPANFLLLDEPTNHLDIAAKGVLIEALRQYAGTFVVVSHDRHFLDAVAGTVWRVGGGRVEVFPGTYSEYRWHREHGTARRAAPDAVRATAETGLEKRTEEPPERAGGPKTKAQKRREAEARNRRHRKQQRTDGPYAALNPYQLRQALEEAEAAILKKEEHQAQLEAALADPALYDEPERAREISRAYDDVKEELAALYEKWEQLAERVTAREAS